MILNKNKRIGNVIYIVEGVKDEIELLKEEFNKLQQKRANQGV